MILPVEKAVRAKLTTSAPIAALVGTRVYSTQAPLEAALPYIEFAITAGGSPNESPRDALDVMVTVKCVAADSSGVSGATQADQVADLIRAALHNQPLTIDAPWAVWDCQHEQVFSYVENEDRRQYYHTGGIYRVRAAS